MRRGRCWHYDTHRVLRHLVTDPDPGRDERLYDLLATCLRDARGQHACHATPGSARGHDPAPKSPGPDPSGNDTPRE